VVLQLSSNFKLSHFNTHSKQVEIFLRQEGLTNAVVSIPYFQKGRLLIRSIMNYILSGCMCTLYTHTSICPSICLSVCLSIHLINSTKQILHKKLTVGQLVKKFPALTVLMLILTTFLTFKLKASFIGHLFTKWQAVECQHFLMKGRHKTAKGLIFSATNSYCRWG